MNQTSSPCPCGSGTDYPACCGRYIDSATPAPTAEALMRSRYTAYTAGNDAYLRKTWDTDTCPKSINASEPGIEWTGLKIIATTAGGEDDTTGTVEFVAGVDQQGQSGHLHELSDFKRDVDGRWLYVSGDTPKGKPIQRAQKVGRNEPCPCGSGKKYKKCCGAPGAA